MGMESSLATEFLKPTFFDIIFGPITVGMGILLLSLLTLLVLKRLYLRRDD